MERQLVLLEPVERDWQLDEATKAAGLRGVAAARQALQRAQRAAEQRRASPDRSHAA
jgi:hypothetical protein